MLMSEGRLEQNNGIWNMGGGREINIPRTVKDVIMRRMDKLSNEQINREVKLDIGFIINCQGEVGDYHLMRTNNDELFNLIIKLLKEKCVWKPGKQKNLDIDMYYSFNVTLSGGKLKLKAQNYRY